MPATVSLRFLKEFDDLETFKDSEATYRVPASVKGLVRVSITDAPADVQALIVNFIGISKFSFVVNSGTTRVKVFEHEDVITNQTMIVPTGWKANSLVGVGVYVYAFEFDSVNEDGNLLLPTVTGKLGTIDYHVEARLYCTNESCNKKVKQNIRLLNSPEIERLPEADKLVTKGEDEFILGCCWRTANIRIAAELPKGAYAPGEIMEVKLDVANCSKKNMTAKVGLFRVTRLIIDGCAKIDETEVLTNQDKELIPPEIEHWSTTMSLVIPEEFYPGSVHGLTFLEVGYFIKIKLDIPWELPVHCLRLPVVIGH